jgi:hypothetical protein
MWADLIHDANCEQDVYFLLDAYIEGLRYADQLRLLPAYLVRMPVEGESDVGLRFGRLMFSKDGAADAAVMRQAQQVFGSAMLKLKALRGETIMPLTNSERGIAAQFAAAQQAANRIGAK